MEARCPWLGPGRWRNLFLAGRLLAPAGVRLLDLVTDVNLAIGLHGAGEGAWFAGVVTFLVLPYCLSVGMLVIMRKPLWMICCGVVQLHHFAEAACALRAMWGTDDLRLTYDNDHIRSVFLFRGLEAGSESFPQAVLQLCHLYTLVCYGGAELAELTLEVISVCISVVSIVMCLFTMLSPELPSHSRSVSDRLWMLAYFTCDVVLRIGTAAVLIVGPWTFPTLAVAYGGVHSTALAGLLLYRMWAHVDDPMLMKVLVALVLALAAHILPLPLVLPGMMYNSSLSPPLWYAVVWRQAEHLAGIAVAAWRHGLLTLGPGALAWAASLCALARITAMLHGDDYGKKHVPCVLRSPRAAARKIQDSGTPRDTIRWELQDCALATRQAWGDSEGSSPAPPSVPVPLARTPIWNIKVAELCERGFTLHALLDFYKRLGTEDLMPEFSPRRSTTRDVVCGAIVPGSRKARGGGGMPDGGLGNCAYATLMNSGEPVLPMKVVTHHWGHPFSHTVAAVVADALELPTYSKIARRLSNRMGITCIEQELFNKEKLNLTYWLCALSVNQHCSACDELGPDGVAEEACGCGLEKHRGGDLCETNKFDDVMAELCRRVPCIGQVLVVDEHFSFFSRAWCVAELAEARRLGMPQAVKMHSSSCVRMHGQTLLTLDMRKCETSREEDADLILSKIPDIDQYNLDVHDALLNDEVGLLAEWRQESRNRSVLERTLGLGRLSATLSPTPSLSPSSTGEPEEANETARKAAFAWAVGAGTKSCTSMGGMDSMDSEIFILPGDLP